MQEEGNRLYWPQSQGLAAKSEQRPERFYAILATAILGLLAFSVVALFNLVFLVTQGRDSLVSLSDADTAMNRSSIRASLVDQGNQRTVDSFQSSLDDAVTSLEALSGLTSEQLRISLEQTTEELLIWAEELTGAQDELGRQLALDGLSAAISQTSDDLAQVRPGVEESIDRLDNLSRTAAIVMLVALLMAAYLLMLWYSTVAENLRWQRSMVEALHDGGGELPLTRMGRQLRLPGAGPALRQTKAVALELGRLAQAERRHANANQELSAELRHTIEELLESREEFAKEARLVAIGRIAGGVSHDINNPVTGVLGYLDFIERHADQEKVRTYAGKAQREVERIGRIASTLLVFSRTGVDDSMTDFDLTHACTNVLELAETQLRAGDIEVRTKGMERPVHVHGQPDRFQQALLNILLNAMSAMSPEPGRIEVTVAQVEDGEATVSIVDSGPGVPPDLQDKIFEPYFTTKLHERSSGLGLAMVADTMSDMGGEATLDRRYTDGARFVLTMPTVETAAKPTSPDAPPELAEVE